MKLKNLEKKVKLLIVTDQLPFPPRNGITLPIYNYSIGLMKTYQLKILLLVDINNPPSQEVLKLNENIFGKIEVILFFRRRRFLRIFNEILGWEMFQHGWITQKQEIDKVNLQADALIVSPMSAVAKMHSSNLLRELQIQLSIAAVNDCTTAEYYFRYLQSFGGIKLAAKSFVHYFRSFNIARIEAKLLSPYKYVLLQTAKDVELMQQLVSSKVASKVVLVPNGVNEEYFSHQPISSEHRNILFVAELNGEYAPIANWLVNELWPKIVRHHEGYKLIVVGKGASRSLMESINSTNSIIHFEFAEDLGLLYREAMIVISPVFKGYGLINKTLEAMASGIPVVGGMAAFNGIKGFKSGKHGLACKTNDTKEFADAVLSLISDATKRLEIGIAGRDLLLNQFRWEYALSKIQGLLQKTYDV